MKITKVCEFDPREVENEGFKAIWEKVLEAGKEDAFLQLLEGSWTAYPKTDDVIRFVVGNKGYIYKSLGLDDNGDPIDGKPYTVFLRVTALVKEEVMANDPEEAKTKALCMFQEEEEGDPIFSAFMDDVQEVEAAAYDDGSGNTMDY